MAVATAAPFLDALLEQPRPAAFDRLRQAAEAQLQGQGLPTRRLEDWKYTDLKPLQGFQPSTPTGAGMDLKGTLLPEARGSRMVFQDGVLDEHHSNLSSLPPGVRLLRLSQAPDLASLLGTLAGPDHPDLFSQLNAARFQDGALLLVPKGLRVEPVIHVVFAQRAGATSLPRLLVVVERGAEVHLVEEYLGEGAYFTSAVAEVFVHADALLRHERIQRESPEASHFNHLAAQVDRGGRYECRTVTLGARLSRQTPRVVLADEGADLSLDALALIGGDQVADTHSVIDHQSPHCTSRQLHKSVLDGASRAIFNGKIFVREGAQLTNAQQQSRNLLLSDRARVDAKPELEIYADDVKCAHGATVGQLEAEELFYLMSRGLNPQDARNLLTYGFAAEILAPMAIPTLRRTLRKAVLDRTSQEA